MNLGNATIGKILKARWLYARRYFSESFWFTPSLLLLGGVLLAAATLTLDELGTGAWLHANVLRFPLGPETTQRILSTVATGMVTVSSIVFSLIFVALTITAQQLGPRIISRAMSDPANRSVLGIFVSTFVYALIILGATGKPEVPSLYTSIAVLFVLVLVSFAYLFHFVHHNALSCQADSVLSWLADELRTSIHRNFPERRAGEPFDGGDAEVPSVPDDAMCIRSMASGYIQVVGFDALVRLGSEKRCCIWLHCQPGDYVLRDQVIADISDSGISLEDEDREEIHAAIVLGPKRTAAQDFAFQMRAIVDIGVRALSPSLNDFHTAISTVDWVSGAVAEILMRRVPGPLLRDEAGELRVVAEVLTFPAILLTAYQQLLEAMQGNLSVTLHLLQSLTRLAALADDDARYAVRAFGGKVADSIGRLDLNEADRERAEAALARFSEACA